jgi:integrase
LIATNPCILKDELPEKKDKDRAWRRTAVFTRDEVQQIISAKSEHIPDDRRMMYSLMFLGAMRFGEAAALTFRDYDPEATPLGKLIIEKSYSSKIKKVKATKTDNPREMPVHPTLAKLLAEWKLEGFERYMGRKPMPEDMIAPSRHKRPATSTTCCGGSTKTSSAPAFALGASTTCGGRSSRTRGRRTGRHPALGDARGGREGPNQRPRGKADRVPDRRHGDHRPRCNGETRGPHRPSLHYSLQGAKRL